MRFCSVVIAVSITAQVLGYPTDLAKRVSISSIGDVAGSEVTSGGKEVGGTSLDALTTAQTEGIVSVGTPSRKGSTGIQTISNEDLGAASEGEENGINLGGANGEGDDKKNIGSQGPSQAVTSENKPKISLVEGKKLPSTTEAGSQSIQEVTIGGKKGVLVGGGQEANALANSLGANFEFSKGESEVGKEGKDSGEARAKEEAEMEAEAEAEAAENGKKSSKAETKEKESTVQAEDANVGLVVNGTEIPINPGAVNNLSDISKEINDATSKSDKNSAALQIEQKRSNLEADNEKANTSETKDKESKSGQISTGTKFGVNFNGKEYSLGSNLGFNFKKEDTETGGQENDDSLNAIAQASGGLDEEGSIETIKKSDDDNNNGKPEEVKASEDQEEAVPCLSNIASNGQRNCSAIPPAQLGISQEKVENGGKEAVATEKEKEKTETEEKSKEAAKGEEDDQEATNFEEKDPRQLLAAQLDGTSKPEDGPKLVEAQNIGQNTSSGENQPLAPQVSPAGQAGQAKKTGKQASQAGNESQANSKAEN